MSNHHSNWIRVNRANPCPICDKPDNCNISRDGNWVWCGRVSDGSIRENSGGQFLHHIAGGNCRSEFRGQPSTPSPRSPAVVKDSSAEPESKTNRREIQRRALVSFNAGSEKRGELATNLMVSVDALTRLQVGWDVRGACWDFPERDAEGQIIGINRRYRSGKKKRVAGGKSGLTYARDWDTGDGPIYLVEGGSDTAALMTIGFNVIGRPSNTGGVTILAEVLESFSPEREIIVIGERDEKPNGLWPGRDGAISTATKLSELLDRPIHWSLPPDEAKDSRAWLQSAPKLPPDRLACLFADGLAISAINPPPLIEPNANTGPIIALPDWREWMFRERMASIECPGFYLDLSQTGAGKSTIDFRVLQQAMNAESA